MLPRTLLSLIFIALSVVDASPLTHHDVKKGTLRFAMRMNLNSADGRTLRGRDRMHTQAMIQANSLAQHGDPSITISNDLFVYTARVGVGKPQQNYSLLIDTGSSNTWVGANENKPYIRTKTSVATGNSFNLVYSANVTGEEYLDTVTLSPELVIRKQSIGAATRVNGSLEGLDGILGIGPTDLTLDTVSNTTVVPTVVDSLFSQRKISEKMFGLYFEPSAALDSNGKLTFGGCDESVITSPIEYVPLTNAYPASRFWGVKQSVRYGDQTIMSNATGVVDTGTTLILFATEAFQKYQDATGAVMDDATGLLAINAFQYANLKSLSFHIGGVDLGLAPNGQIWPRSLNTAMGGNASAIYLIVGDLGYIPDLPIGFIDGYSLLQRFYSVWDTKHRRIGFAKTAYTDSLIS